MVLQQILVKDWASLAAKYRTHAYEYTGYLHNIHDLASYYKANMEMLDKKKARFIAVWQSKDYHSYSK